MDKKTSQKFKRPALLMIGCGDVGLRMLPWLCQRFRVFAVMRNIQRCAAIRALGAVPVLADLDQPASLRRLAGLARVTQYILHLAPPPSSGSQDTRSRRLCAILPAQANLVYVSTSGVYGDCGGERIDETRRVRPHNARAVRRVDAEQVLRAWAARNQAQLAILRVPGIYAADRLPLARLEKRTPALLASEDVYTNHIHAEDLARICALALFRARPQRVYHAVDDSQLKMGEYFDLVADHFQLERAPRLTREEIQTQLSPVMLSFMSESRILDNRRLKQELRIRLRFPDVSAGLLAIK